MLIILPATLSHHLSYDIRQMFNEQSRILDQTDGQKGRQTDEKAGEIHSPQVDFCMQSQKLLHLSDNSL